MLEHSEIISSPTMVLMTNGNEWARAWPGDADFTVEADRAKVKQLTNELLQIKCQSLWVKRDMSKWRFYKALFPRGQGHPEMPEDTATKRSLSSLTFHSFFQEDLPSFLQRYNLDNKFHHLEQGGLSPLMLAGGLPWA